MSQAVKEEKIKIPGELNEGQAEAFLSLASYLNDREDNDIYVLKGWAGTGKTYTISKLIKFCLSDKRHRSKSIAVTGPTNKSVRVIKQSTGIIDKRISYSTIHKLLGLTEKITMDGKQEFTPNRFEESNIEFIQILFIDEVSMLNDELFEEVIKHRNRIKIICMGDPCQIPPVGKPDCIPFTDDLHEIYKIKVVELKEVMRQKGDNPIISKSVIIRNNLHKSELPLDTVSDLNQSGEGIKYLNLNLPEGREEFSSRLGQLLNSDEFEKNPDLVRIIAWRNKTVDTMNLVARKKIYGEQASTSFILIGERMVANSPVFMRENIVLTTNEEFVVEGYEKVLDEFRLQINDKPADPFSFSLYYYKASISYLNDNGVKIRTKIHILHEDSRTEHAKILNLLKLKAIEKKGADKSWIKYYNFMKRYADVNHSYSSTSHKAQGSTYNHVFVLEDDIDMNWDVIERNRIKYTAFTRASQNLYIVKKF